MQEKQVAVFLNSCDKNSDVCKYFLMAFQKYWGDCSFPKFAGVNDFTADVSSFGFVPIRANKSNWKEESIIQLNYVKNIYPNITYVIFFLDDFILNKKVNVNLLSNLIKYSEINNSYYIRMKSLEEGFFLKTCNFFKKNKIWGNINGIKIRKTHPYYSALQIALWDISYLIKCIENCKDIWDFEKFKSYHKMHYSVSENIFNYRHIIEKGKWDLDIEKYCIKSVGSFSYGARIKRKLSVFGKIKFFFRKTTFFIFGFSILRIRLYIYEKIFN